MRFAQQDYLNLVRLHPKQQEVWAALQQSDRVALAAGRRFGKSTLMAAWLLWRVLCQKRCWLIAPSYELTRTVYDLMVEHASRLPAGLRKRLKWKRSFPLQVSYQAGWCAFHSSENAVQLQGRGIHTAVFDEAGDIRDLWRIVAQYVTPATLDTQGQLIAVGTPRGKNDFHDFFMREDVVRFQFASADNPYLSAEAVQAMMEEIGEELAEQELMGQFVEWSGRFFAVQPVVEDADTPIEPLWCGIDWGYASPFAAVWCGHDGDRYVVVHEVYAAGLDPDQQAKLVLDAPRASVYIADPSTPNTVLEAWRQAGLSVRLGMRDRVGGLHAMRQLVRQGRLVVRGHCFNLLREFAEAMVDSRRGDDIDPHCEDHALDALRYALVEMPKPKKQQQSATPMEWFIRQSFRKAGVRL